MSYAAERQAIEQRFAAAWTATPIAWDNVSFTPPTGPWVRLHIVNGDAFQAAMGAPTVMVRHPGTVIVEVYVPPGTGTDTGRGLADQAAAIFRFATFDGIVCGTPTLQPVEHADGWFQIRVAVAFRRDEFF
jgi:Bacteriophage related domain of unknown function